MQVARAARAAVLVASLTTGVAGAQPDASDTFSYRVRKGDTLELVAAELYGDRGDALLLLDANKLPRARPLVPGEKLRIPRNREHVTQPDDTWASLARDLLGDERRAPFLAGFNDVGDSVAPPPTDPLTAGTLVDIPLTVAHESAGAESLEQVATAYFGDARYADMLKRYNLLDHDTLDKGDKLLVPIPHLKVRTPKPANPDDDAARRHDRQRSVGEAAAIALPRARDAWNDGDFHRVVELLGKDTIDLDYLDVGPALDVGVLLGQAYAALGLDAQALQTFQRVLRRKPDRALDAFSYSPKVRELWKKAGGKVNDA